MAKKAKKNEQKPVRVAFILDRSGSMSSVWEATISGFNEYVDGLRADKKTDYRFSLTLFDAHIGTDIEQRYTNVPLDQVEPLTTETYVPRGSTPLYDAACKTIQAVAADVGKDDPVLVAILTDGMENASTEYTEAQLKAMVDRYTKQGNFTFTFMGANIDAYAAAAKFGIPQGNAVQFTADAAGTSRVMHTHSLSTAHYAAQAAQGVGVPVVDFYSGSDKPEKKKESK